jgi:nitrous oxidase accessory protein
MKNICLVLSFVVFTITANAKTWIVRPAGPLQTLQEAINNAMPGDTIMVERGVYREPTIVVNKPLYLKGIGYPVLDGQKKNEIMIIKSSRVIVEGFALQHSGYSGYNDIAAILIVNSRNVIIRNNKLDDTFFGIYSQHANNCTISNNELRSNAVNEITSANGIHCWKSDSMLIVNNKITGHRDGIYFEFVTNSMIKNNTSTGNVRYGLHFMFSNNDAYVGNQFRNNGAGVAVMFSKGVTMLQNTFIENWGSAAYGILLKEISDSRIAFNRFVRNTTGIYMEGTNRIKVEQNVFDNNGWALKIQASCSENTVTQNNFLGNSFDVATNGSLVLNSFNSNYWDKYEGYDLNRDGVGDVPYRPVSVYAMIAERNPVTMMLFRSFITTLLDKAEKTMPGFIPENLKDDQPRMKIFRRATVNAGVASEP